MAGVRHVKVEEQVALLARKRLAVDEQLHLGLVGIHRHARDVLHAVHIPLAAQVHERLVAQPRLVRIERVLLVRAVERDQALVVLPVLTALVARVGAKVEHVPHVRRPEVRALADLPDQLLVVIRLVFLGVVALLRVGGVPVERLAPVLADADGQIRPLAVEVVEPRAVHVRVAAVPAEVVVVGHHVRNGQVRRVDVAHGDDRNGRFARRVQLVAQVVEQAVVLNQVGVVLAVHRDLVGQAPHDDGRVVVVLHDQLAHLRERVFAPAGHVPRDVRDLRPHDEPALVAQVVERLAVLVVRKAHGRRAQLADEVDVAAVVLFVQRVANALPVLVAGNAAQRVFLPVEQEAAVRVDCKRAAAEAGADAVEHGLPVEQLHPGGVQVRVLAPVPAARPLDRQRAGGLLRARLRRGNGLPRRVEQGVAQRLAGPCVREPHAHLHLRVVSRERGRDGDAGAAAVIQVEVRSRHADEPGLAVQPAIEREVGHLRVDALVRAVVHVHRQHVVVPEGVGQIHAPRGVAAVVVHERRPVERHVRRGIRPLQFEVHPLAGRQLAARDAALIAAGAAVIVVAAVLPVQGVPCVRQRDGLRRLPRLGERPAVVQRADVAPAGLLGIMGHMRILLLPAHCAAGSAAASASSSARRASSSAFMWASVFLSML